MLHPKRTTVESHFNSSRLVSNFRPDPFPTGSVLQHVQIQGFRLPWSG